jgi:uncharacterized protein
VDRARWLCEGLCGDTVSSRLLGLAWLDGLHEGAGLLIPRCRSVHTFGMRFALDVAFLDGEGRVLRRVEAVPPRRLLWCRSAAAVLERKARPSSAEAPVGRTRPRR